MEQHRTVENLTPVVNEMIALDLDKKIDDLKIEILILKEFLKLVFTNAGTSTVQLNTFENRAKETVLRR